MIYHSTITDFFDLQFHTSILSWLRYSDGFSKLIHLLSEPVHVRNPVYLEIEFTVFILFDRADGVSGIKTSVKFGRIEFAFYPDFLELAQSSDYSVIESQSVTQEVYYRHQLLHIWKVASDKIRKLRQLAVLLLVSVSYLLYLLGLLPFPLSGFVFKFKDAVLQILVPALQRFHLSTSEKRAHTACKGGCRIGGCVFELVGTDFRFHLLQFLLRLGFLLLQQSGFSFEDFILLFQVPIILHGGGVPCFRTPYPTLQSVFRHHPCVIVVVGDQGLADLYHHLMSTT